MTNLDVASNQSTAGAARAVSMRAVLIGLGITVGVGLMESHINAFASHHPIGLGTAFIHSNMPMGAVFPVFLVLLVFNLGFGRFRPSLRLSAGELGVIFAIALAATAAPLFYTIFIIGMFTGPHYFGRTDQDVADTVMKHVPSWIAPSDANHAILWYFEGVPEGQKIPWQDWVVPVLAWAVLGLAVVFTCYCLVAMMRRQWVDRERLAFPLVQLPQQLIAATEPDDDGNPLLRKSTFWLGFLLSFSITAINTLHGLDPTTFPGIALGRSIHLGRGLPAVHVFGRMSFVGMGFAYLTPVNISLSIWLFFWVIWAERAFLRSWGYSVGSYEFYQWTEPNTSWQCFGALMAFTTAGLWLARRHLRDVLRKALWLDPSIDDSREFLSYRMALFGSLGGIAVISGWLALSGMEWKAVVIVVPAIFLCFLAVAKIVAQTGLIQFTLPGVPQRLVFFGIGSDQVTPQTMTALGFSYGWFGDVQSTFISAATHGVRLTNSIRTRKRWIGFWLLMAFALGCLAAGSHTILIGYRIGALNFDDWPTRGNFLWPFREVVHLMKHPTGPEWTRLSYFLMGSVVMVVLMVLMHFIHWWPVHPVGFAVGSTFPVAYLWFPFFMAWLVKVTVLRLWGAVGYRALIPVAIGLILGQHVGWGLQGILLLILTW
ncbi:MAG: hypothetical protein QGG53_35160 [Planctomycetota bacterium]|nr:hypothetical protein [Planctomycetota bacterium]